LDIPSASGDTEEVCLGLEYRALAELLNSVVPVFPGAAASAALPRAPMGIVKLVGVFSFY